MSEYAKHIQTIEDMWKKRIELREEGCEQMSMKQTMCEFVHGMKCDEVCKFLGEIVRCRDCKYYETVPEDSGDWCGYWTDRIYADARGSGFCAWGVKEES